MKNGKALHKIIGCGVVMLAVFVFAGAGYSDTPCNTCQTCEQSQYPVRPAVQKVQNYAELQYKDGYPGPRLYKRLQVQKLQCMLSALGYCSGPIDGWYGKSTAKGVMLFLADTFQEIGYGKSISKDQFDHLESWVGSHCTQYDQKKTYQYQYPASQYQYQQFYNYSY
ncbi:MAG: hypothetical protein D3915_01775 [Candidatus Electrothrix sp. AU1_5]|nr:hypothetical protein [Candidatus Electrothrix gigas]